jgi:hypothetical protein
MTVLEFPGPDPQRSRLRAAVATIDAAISRLPREPTNEQGLRPPTELDRAWAILVGQLALGPEPELRECHACHRMVMREATACGFCFAALPPVASPT